MRKLIMFNMTSLDGFFEAPGHDITWHTVDDEFNDFAIQQIGQADTILFGRKTYDLMVSYWPTKDALENDPAVAGAMNSKAKIVVSTTLKEATWNNTKLIGRDAEAELRRMKQMPGGDMIIFGSATLCSSLIKSGLMDELRIMISPIVLVQGTPLFRDIVKLRLTDSRRFRNGNVLMTYSLAE